jgi:hypothetical protein
VLAEWLSMRHLWTMAGLRGEERWAQACIKHALPGVTVRQHDDGSMASMHDLDIVYPDGLAAAVEVTAAADAESVELRNLMRDDVPWREPGIAGGWWVGIRPPVRVRRLRSKLPGLLARLEEQGLAEIRGGASPAGPLAALAADLGIVQARQGATEHRGSIYITVEFSQSVAGGMVPRNGDPLAAWLSDWVGEPAQADNLRKLGQSGAGERHLFVLVPSYSPAPFAAADLLMLPGAPLPEITPVLPAEITHIWTMSTWSDGDGFRWSPDKGWARFRKVFRVK